MTHAEAASAATCPGCGMAGRPGAQVCRNCGLPIARTGDPSRGVASEWFEAPGARSSPTTAVVGLALVLGLFLVAGTLAVSGGGILRRGGRLALMPVVSPSPDVDASRSLSGTRLPPIRAETGSASTEPAETAPVEASAYTCDGAEIRDTTRSRWRLQAVRAGARRSFERVTLELRRRGNAKRAGRIAIEWMSPNEARRTFGLPRFQGQRGLLLTFGGQFSAVGAQLIGTLDLRPQGIESISGIYRFVDVDGGVRAFIAVRDQACVRIRAPQLEDQGRASRRATILLDLRAP